MDAHAIRSLVEQAIALAGSEKKLGDLTGYSQNAIWHAKRQGRVSPPLAKAIDAATGGQVPKHLLCPNVFDPPADVPRETVEAAE